MQIKHIVIDVTDYGDAVPPLLTKACNRKALDSQPTLHAISIIVIASDMSQS